jgi:hypothetical protein
MFSYVFAIFTATILALMVLGSVQSSRKRKVAVGWLTLDAVVIKAIHRRNEESDYDIVVEYDYNGTMYATQAERFYEVGTRHMAFGEAVKIKVNPERPEQCVLFSRS